jgi:hypothetical protein
MRKPERSGDLGAAIDSADRKAVAAQAAVVFLVGVAIVAAVAVAQLRRAQKGERAEWAFWCQQMEFERDEARARFKVDSDGEVTEA